MRFSSKILWKVYNSTWSCTLQGWSLRLPDQYHPRRFKKDHFKPLFCYLDRLALEFWQGSFLRSSSELEPSSAFINKLDWNNSTIFQLIIHSKLPRECFTGAEFYNFVTLTSLFLSTQDGLLCTMSATRPILPSELNWKLRQMFGKFTRFTNSFDGKKLSFVATDAQGPKASGQGPAQ